MDRSYSSKRLSLQRNRHYFCLGILILSKVTDWDQKGEFLNAFDQEMLEEKLVLW